MAFYPVQELTTLSDAVLVAHNTAPTVAASVSASLVQAQIDGQLGHGLSRLPSYAAQAASGKIDGHATPDLTAEKPAAVRIDARGGFAYPALEMARDEVMRRAPEAGISVAAIANSHHCGVAGYHAERIAEAGLVALMFANSPQAIAPWGGSKGLFGTNPIAFACPSATGAPILIDMSLSKVARGKIMVAAKSGSSIPTGWALDADGQPTTDPNAAMAGTMLPMGDAKGAALAMMVELLTAALTGSHFGFEASSFFEAEGPSPAIGQTIIAIDPGPLSGGRFTERLETLATAMLDQDGVRLPGTRRLESRAAAARDGVTVEDTLMAELRTLAGE